MYPQELFAKLRGSSGFIAKNGLSVLLRMLAIAFVFFPQRWLNQNLSSEVFAQYNVGIAVIGVLLGTLGFGIPQLLHRVYTHLEAGEERNVVWSSLALLRLLSFGVGLIILWVISLFGLVPLSILFFLYLPMFLFLADVGFRSIVDADNRSWQYSFSDLLSKITLNVGLFFLAGHLPLLATLSPFYHYAFSSILSALVALGIDAWWQRKHYRFVRPSLTYLHKVRATVGYLGLTGFLVGAFLTTDRIFLDAYGYSSEIINGYSNAYKLFEVAAVVPGITMPVLASSVIKKLRALEDTERRASVKRYLQTTLGVGFFTALCFAVGGPIALRLIDPEGRYLATSLPTLWLLAPAVVLSFGTVFITHIMLLTGNDKPELWIQSRNLIFAVIVYALLIYRYAYTGAAISTVLIYFFDLLQRWWAVFTSKNKVSLALKD